MLAFSPSTSLSAEFGRQALNSVNSFAGWAENGFVQGFPLATGHEALRCKVSELIDLTDDPEYTTECTKGPLQMRK